MSNDKLPPPPGVCNLDDLEGKNIDESVLKPNTPEPGVSAATEGPAKQASSMPEHLKPMTDREAALRHFEHVAFTKPNNPNEPVGYIVQIDLKNQSKVKKSSIVDGKMPESMYNKYKGNKELFSGDENPENLVYKEASTIPQKDMIRSPKSPDRMDDPVPGEGRLKSPYGGPQEIGANKKNSKAFNHLNKKLWDQQNKTTVVSRNAREHFNTSGVDWYKSGSIQKFAEALNINLEPYQALDIWTNAITPPVIFDIIMLSSFGKDWLEWEPETLWQALEPINGGVISQENKDKIQAVKTLHVTDAFWEDMHAFEKMGLALNGIHVVFNLMQDFTTEQIAKAVVISSRIKTGIPFSEDVKAYVGTKAHEEGFVYLPPILEFAQPYLNKLQMHTIHLVPQVKQAYLNKWPVGEGDDLITVQLNKLYHLDTFIAGL
jgi:hypothetical protein